jgi:hypothetical protein
MIVSQLEKLTQLNVVKQVGFWLLLFGVNLIVLVHLGYRVDHALKDSLITSTLLFSFAFLLKKIIFFFHSKEVITAFTLTLVVAFSVTELYLHQEIGLLFGPEKELYINFFQQKNSIRIGFNFLILILILHQIWIQKYKIYQVSRTQELIEIERQLNQSELINIQQQLKPHFIFNSLNSINALTQIEPKEAQRMVQLLSDFLRGTLRKDAESYTSLKEELDYMNLYLEIEKVRFRERLQVELKMDSEIENWLVPLFILQPVVENAIKYGLEDNLNQLNIKINITKENNQITISISNPYDAESAAGSKGVGYGLDSIEKKLRLLYKKPHLLLTSKTATEFTTQIIIPQNQN